MSKVSGVSSLLLSAHFCIYKSFCSLHTQGEEGSVLLGFPHCRSPAKLPVMTVRILRAAAVEGGTPLYMVVVLLKMTVPRLLAGVQHWMGGAGLSRLVSIPMIHPSHHPETSLPVRDTVMPPRSPPPQARSETHCRGDPLK